MGKPGRPKAWVPDERDIKFVHELAGIMTQEQLAKFFDVHINTFRARMKEHPELRAAWEGNEKERMSEVAYALYKNAIGGSITAQKFYLSARGWKDKPSDDGVDPAQAQAAEAARREVVGRLDRIARRIETEGGPHGAGDD